MSDEQGWVEAARQEDVQAWEHLVNVYQAPVFRLAYLLLGDADKAEDAAQETFIRAHHALPRFDSQRPVKPWLLRITANICRNQRRGLGRYLAALQRAQREEISLLPASTARQAEQGLEAETLWASIRTLGLDDQRILYLRYFLDCSEAETAAVLGVPPGTVKSRHHRALKRLRDVLEIDHPDLVNGGSDAG